MKEKIKASNFLDRVASEIRRMRELGKEKKRFFWGADGWKALSINCEVLSGPDIGRIEPTNGMIFMGCKHFIRRLEPLKKE